MTTPATDFRHFRFFRSLTRRAAIFAVRACYAATVRIPAFSFVTVTHCLGSLLKEADVFLEPDQVSVRGRWAGFLWTRS